MVKKLLKTKGYSLIELLVYIAILSLVFIVVIESLINSMKTYVVAQSYRRLQNDGELVLERITREVRSANLVPSGTFGVNPSSFSLEQDFGGTTKTISFAVVNGVLQMTDAGITTALTSNKTIVDSFIVHKVTGALDEVLRIQLVLETTTGLQVTAPFYTTLSLRDS